MSPEERDALVLFLRHAVGLGDEEGSLSDAETLRIARAVAGELDSGTRRITTKFGPFIVHVTLERLPR